VIEFRELTKRYGDVLALDGLSCTVQAGRVTGFLGPNGSGKSTALRLALGLNTPTGGSATIGGRPYQEYGTGLHSVGALLDANDVHKGHSGATHLAALARSNGIPRRRVAEVLEQVGLASAAHRRVRGYSLGMRQRLGIAAALLGDPPVLIFDEPANGLDPEGIRWVRGLFRSLAAEGRAVFVSSHQIAEMENTADHLIVIAGGRLVADEPAPEFARRSGGSSVLVRSPDAARLAQLLSGAGGRALLEGRDVLRVTGLAAQRIGEIAHEHRVLVHEIAAQAGSMEDAFMRLTADRAEYRAAAPSERSGNR
jgi:ABC-2 type transport system ATP-binding protein